jgi:3-hydroxyacyl-CoA dehydrogenase
MQTRRQVEKANNRMKSMLRILVENKVISQAQSDEASKLFTVTTSVEEAVTGAFFIQESGPELLETKRTLFDQIEEFAAPDAIIASSTSKLRCTDMQKGAKHPSVSSSAIPTIPLTFCP